MKKPQLPETIPRSATRQSRLRDGPGWPGVRHQPLVLYPVVEPGFTQGDKSSHRGRRLGEFARVVVVLVCTVRGGRIGHIGSELDVQATDRRALNTVVTVGRDVVTHQQHA